MAKALLIAEKPSLMREIQDVYRNITHPDTIIFKCFAGHVVGLKNPKEYGVVNGVDWAQKNWNANMIPMVPDSFLYKITSDKRAMFKDLTDEIKSGNYDYIINACDPDREGNHIFQLFYNQAKCKLPVKRFWSNDLSFDSIEKALKNLRYNGDGLKPDLKCLTDAAILRSQFDWLCGMNFTIGVSLNMKSTIKCGRVKTPTSMIVAQREEEIKNFKPTTTYELDSVYKEGFTGTLFNEDGNTRFKDKKDANSILNKLGKTAIVEDISTKKEVTSAPQLYKLSDLQQDASKKYGYNADKVLEIAQSLYEKKVLSYPRTDCRYLGSSLTKDFDKLLASIATCNELNKYVAKVTISDKANVAKNKKYINDAELAKSGHYALSPTIVKPNWSTLSREEQNVLTLVYKRFLSIFMPPMVCNKTTLVTNNNNYTFKSLGKQLLDEGYTVLYESNSTDNILPNLKRGDIVNVEKFELKDKTTTPPPRYTQGSLIAAMENPAKFLTDESLKTILKEKKGIGTEATRSQIIKDLIKDNYIEEKKGKSKAAVLYATDKCMLIYENLKNEDFASVDMTGIWEEKLSDVAEGKMSFSAFEKEMKAYVKDTVDKIKKKQMKVANNNTCISTIKNNKTASNIIGICPCCGASVIEGPKNYFCSNKNCGLSVAKHIKGNNITKTEVGKMLKGKPTKFYKFKSANGKDYEAALSLNNGKLQFVWK